jgi:metal-responsive CopG/Arc/MetJ family transcriptional regulator
MQKYPQINVRVDEAFLKRLDEWRKTEDDLPARPEAIRRLVEQALDSKAKKK